VEVVEVEVEQQQQQQLLQLFFQLVLVMILLQDLLLVVQEDFVCEQLDLTQFHLHLYDYVYEFYVVF
jgi:hypothetical protein